jgi:hypothetical protein
MSAAAARPSQTQAGEHDAHGLSRYDSSIDDWP